MAESPSSQASGANTPVSMAADMSSASQVGAVSDGSPSRPAPSQQRPSETAATAPKPKGRVECISTHLDAFVLNQHIFTDSYYVAPLSIPDHSAFLPGAFSSPDVVPHVDVEASYPWHRNSRIADITKTPPPQAIGPDGQPIVSKEDDPRLRQERLGVYLHWCLPRQFRGVSSTSPDEGDASPPSQQPPGKGGAGSPPVPGDAGHAHAGTPGDICPTCGRPWHTGNSGDTSQGTSGRSGSGGNTASGGTNASDDGGSVEVS